MSRSSYPAGTKLRPNKSGLNNKIINIFARRAGSTPRIDYENKKALSLLRRHQKNFNKYKKQQLANLNAPHLQHQKPQIAPP